MLETALNAEATCLFSVWLASFRWHELYPGLIMELGNLHGDDRLLLRLPVRMLAVKGKCTTGSPWRQNTEASCRGRLIRSSDEASVMEVERRG